MNGNWRKNINDIKQDLLNIKNTTPTSNDVSSLSYPTNHLQAELLNNPKNFTPTFLSKDGFIYGNSQRGSGKKIYRTNDGFETLEEGYEFTNTRQIIATYKTSQGFVVVAEGGTSENPKGEVYFSNDFEGGFNKVLETDIELSPNGISHFFDNSGHKNGLDICMLGEYSQRIGNPHKLYMSLDGGQSWEVVFTSVVNNPNVNSHIHACSFDRYSGDIYVSVGDGEENREFYVSNDMGGTFKKVNAPNNVNGFNSLLQPTIIIPTPDKIFLGVDSVTAPGFYSLIKDIKNPSQVEVDWDLKWDARIRLGSASIDFPVQPFARKGSEIYVCLPERQANRPRRYNIIASGDNGNSWHLVFADIFPQGTFIPNGIVGADDNGYMYQFIRTNVDGAKDYILKIKTGDWF